MPPPTAAGTPATTPRLSCRIERRAGRYGTIARQANTKSTTEDENDTASHIGGDTASITTPAGRRSKNPAATDPPTTADRGDGHETSKQRTTMAR